VYITKRKYTFTCRRTSNVLRARIPDDGCPAREDRIVETKETQMRDASTIRLQMKLKASVPLLPLARGATLVADPYLFIIRGDCPLAEQTRAHRTHPSRSKHRRSSSSSSSSSSCTSREPRDYAFRSHLRSMKLFSSGERQESASRCRDVSRKDSPCGCEVSARSMQTVKSKCCR